VDAAVAPAAALRATVWVQPRTGIFSPPCYKDVVNGFYELDTWTALTLSSGGRSETIKVKDGMSFKDAASCRAYYGRAGAGAEAR
ncbi:MAG: hypothetical protein KGL53_05100, partial [Elusimicrobia bacterium]|nr:hypothetical protein [Elusimicrobiota bacterium]